MLILPYKPHQGEWSKSMAHLLIRRREADLTTAGSWLARAFLCGDETDGRIRGLKGVIRKFVVGEVGPSLSSSGQIC